jgi:hypothetical protein
MDQSSFQRPRKQALTPEQLASEVAKLQQRPEGLSLAMAFLEQQAQLQEQDRIAELEYLQSHPELHAAEQEALALEETAVRDAVSVSPIQQRAIAPDFEPITASQAITASGAIPQVIKASSILRDGRWLTLTIAGAFLGSLASSNMIGDVGNSPAALPILISLFCAFALGAACLLAAAFWLGRRYRTNLGSLFSMPFGFAGGWLVRIASIAASVALLWTTVGQLGYTITGAAGELFQGSSSLVSFSQTGRLSALALAFFALVASVSLSRVKRLRTVGLAVGTVGFVALLVGAAVNALPAIPYLADTPGYIATSPSTLAGYAVLFAVVAFGSAFKFGQQSPESAKGATGLAALTATLFVMPVLTAALLALVNPISTPKWMSLLDLAFIPVGVIAFLAVGLQGIRELSGSSRLGIWLASASVLAAVALPLALDSQTLETTAIADTATVLLAATLATFATNLLVRRHGAHVGSLGSPRGLYGSFRLESVAGLAIAVTAGIAALSAYSVAIASVIALAVGAVWQLSFGLIGIRKQDAELARHASRALDLFAAEEI